MTVIGWLLCLALTQQAPAAPQPVDAKLRALFSVTVTASEPATERVYEYLRLVARRNDLKSRFGERAPAAELELVLLFEPRPKLPWSRRDIGTVNLRLSPENDTARVEYCMRRCTEPEPELVVYSSTLEAFLKKLDVASASMARRYK
jgi:hypothetical protein